MKTILFTMFALVGCSADKEKVRLVLERDGYTDVMVGGWTMFGCDKDDAFSNTFSAKKNGLPVNGYVCSGWLKGFTIRLGD